MFLNLTGLTGFTGLRGSTVTDVEPMALGHVTVLHFSGGQAWECWLVS